MVSNDTFFGVTKQTHCTPELISPLTKSSAKMTYIKIHNLHEFLS